ncbi:MAG TPA: sodium-translocating pyrophosphatase [Chloroflexota bacterium]|nr:sodium-translocating pyrophosphatase [Chloroflexota bacterium]
MALVWLPPVAAVIAIAFSAWLARAVLASDTGTPAMQDVSGTILEGARAFLNRQYKTIASLALVVAVLVGGVLSVVNNDVSLGIHTFVAFLIGAACSGFAGFAGMSIAVRANLRTAAAARTSVGSALTMALRAGAVSGFLVVALSLLGVYILFFAYGAIAHPDRAPGLIVGFAFGASFVALFAQLGGGIYTKAADVGADLVGKVEAGIPEDDPRNPAVVADLVGDNVGDCAGRGADLFESISAENIGAMILGAALYRLSPDHNFAWILLPLVVSASGLIASLIGLLCVRPHSVRNPMRALDTGYWVSSALSFIFLGIVIRILLNNWWFFAAGAVGIVLSLAFVYITEYYTAGAWRPVRAIANASFTGSATTIIQGLAVAFETPAVPVIAIVTALIVAFKCGANAAPAGATDINTYGIYGTAVATMGMLMVAAYVLAMDTFGPITDNAAGIAEMSDASPEVRDTMDDLDSVGNTTKALTKGYAVGSAALAAFLLFSAYIDTVRQAQLAKHLPQMGAIDLSNVSVFAAGLIGAVLIFLFSSLAIRAVGRAAGTMIAEVRRQIKANPGIMAGTSRPDYARCVDISTRAALREMVLPGLLAIATPIAVGLIFRAEAEAAFLMVATMVGIIMANVMNNGGGAWDNGKKYIEAGRLVDAEGNVHGKRSPAHAAAVVGDTVGDPFKDTAGPSLHILMKLLATLTLVLAPLFI